MAECSMKVIRVLAQKNVCLAILNIYLMCVHFYATIAKLHQHEVHGLFFASALLGKNNALEFSWNNSIYLDIFQFYE